MPKTYPKEKREEFYRDIDKMTIVEAAKKHGISYMTGIKWAKAKVKELKAIYNRPATVEEAMKDLVRAIKAQVLAEIQENINRS
jgi:transposase